MRSPQNLLFSRRNNPSSLSLSPWQRCSSPLSILFPPLDPLQQVFVLLLLKTPDLYAVLQLESQEDRVEGEIPSALIVWEGAGQHEIPIPISDQNKCDVTSEDITALITDYAITVPEHLHHSCLSVLAPGTSIIGFPYYKMQFLEKKTGWLISNHQHQLT